MKKYLSFIQVVDVDLEYPPHAGPGYTLPEVVGPAAGLRPRNNALPYRNVGGAAPASLAPRALAKEHHGVIVASKDAPFNYNIRPADDALFTASLRSRTVTVAQYIELKGGLRFTAAMKLATQDSPAPDSMRRRVIFTCQEVLLQFFGRGDPDLSRVFGKLGWVGAFWAIRPQLEFYRPDIPEPVYVQFLHRTLTFAVLAIVMSTHRHDISLAAFVKHSSEQYLHASLAGMRVYTPDRAVKLLGSLSQVVHPVAYIREYLGALESGKPRGFHVSDPLALSCWNNLAQC
ncbi:hypothetical protein JCM10295v2_003222 [Rhodotorula toruloides]